MKGSITVYFSLILLLLLALLTTTVESARLAGIRLRCQDAAALGLESVFADYAAPLFRDYGLLFLEKSYGTGDEEAYLEKYKEYVSYNAECNRGLLLTRSDLFQAELMSVETEEVVYATEQGGRPFQLSMNATMAGDVPAAIIERLMEQVDFTRQSELVTKFFGSVNRISAQITRVDKGVQSIYKKLEQLRQYKPDFLEQAKELKRLQKKLEDACEDYEKSETEEEEEYTLARMERWEERMKDLVEEVKQEQKNLLKKLEEAIRAEEDYEEDTFQVRTELEKTWQELLEKNPDLKQEIAEAMEAELADLMAFSGGVGDIYKVEQTRSGLEDWKAEVQKNIETMEEAGVEELPELLQNCQTKWESLHTEGLQILFDNRKQQGEKIDVIGIVKGIWKNGMLDFVLDGQEIPKAEIPKEVCVERTEEEGKIETEIMEAVKENIITGEYVLLYLSDFLEEQKENVFSYEVEYVLQGNLENRKNLEDTVQEMALLRTGMNLVYLLSDAESRRQAEGLAMVLVGFTGMMGLVRMTQLLILAAWAGAEAMLDVKGLLAGEPVELLKTKESWNVSLSELKNFANQKTDSRGNRGKGLSYEEYLRILLLKEDQREKRFRIMEVIQAKIQEGGWEEFRMENCIYAVQLSSKFRAPTLFLNLNPLRYLKGRGDNYQIQTIGSYAYE